MRFRIRTVATFGTVSETSLFDAMEYYLYLGTFIVSFMQGSLYNLLYERRNIKHISRVAYGIFYNPLRDEFHYIRHNVVCVCNTTGIFWIAKVDGIFWAFRR